VQAYLQAVVENGAKAGLEMNWDKVEVVRINHQGVLTKPDGSPVKIVSEAKYLGGILSEDGRAGPELTRRLGEATGSFGTLERIWKHTRIPRWRKHEIYVAFILPKLLYGLDTMCFTAVEKQKIDAFHVRCLRRVYGIAYAYYSRMSNAEVLRRARERPLTKTLLERQLGLLGRLARSPHDDPARAVIFEAGSLQPRRWQGKRRRGRPRLSWMNVVYGHAVCAAGNTERLQELLGTTPSAKAKWKRTIRQYCL